MNSHQDRAVHEKKQKSSFLCACTPPGPHTKYTMNCLEKVQGVLLFRVSKVTLHITGTRNLTNVMTYSLAYVCQSPEQHSSMDAF